MYNDYDDYDYGDEYGGHTGDPMLASEYDLGGAGKCGQWRMAQTHDLTARSRHRSLTPLPLHPQQGVQEKGRGTEDKGGKAKKRKAKQTQDADPTTTVNQ